MTALSVSQPCISIHAAVAGCDPSNRHSQRRRILAMRIKPAHLICCSNEKCPEYAVLPRQSHLGKFDEQAGPSAGVWPILYLCLPCGRLSRVRAEMIRQVEEAEALTQYQLVRYDFSSERSGTSHHCAIYTQETGFDIAHRVLSQQDGREAIERILKVSKIWDGSYRDRINVSIDRGLQHPVPKTPLALAWPFGQRRERD